MKLYPIYLSESLHQRAKRLAEKTGRSFSGLVRFLLIREIEKHEDKDKRARRWTNHDEDY